MVLRLKARKSRSLPGLAGLPQPTEYREPNNAQPNNAGWSSPVARQAHNLKVEGSNPSPATNPTPEPPRFRRFSLRAGGSNRNRLFRRFVRICRSSEWDCDDARRRSERRRPKAALQNAAAGAAGRDARDGAAAGSRRAFLQGLRQARGTRRADHRRRFRHRPGGRDRLCARGRRCADQAISKNTRTLRRPRAGSNKPGARLC